MVPSHNSMIPNFADSEMSTWANLIERECGIHLDTSKAYLIQTRLAPLLRRLKMNSFSDLYKSALENRGIVTEIVSAISTHETYFFRDKAVFDILKSKVIPMLFDTRDSLQIWSAACSTGQETYSLAMICRELPHNHFKKHISIVGTDICATSIETARRGIYSEFELSRGLDERQIERYFSVSNNEARVIDSIKSLVDFRHANLFDPLEPRGVFDLVLCRNVAMYFSRQKRAELYSIICKRMRPGGMLIIGTTETMDGISDCFRCLTIDKKNFYVRC